MPRKLLLPFVIIMILCTSACQSGKNKMARQIAKAYGLAKIDDIKTVAFTFNVSVGNDTNAVHRHWSWNRDTHMVTYKTKDTSITYNEAAEKDSFQQKIDKMFINDQYWLLFPFHLVWDDNVKLSPVMDTTFPMSGVDGRCLMVSYNNVGYTPKDKYELYVDDSDMIREWVYRPGNDTSAHVMSWDGYKDFNGIKVSTQHFAKNNFHLWLSDISFTK